MIFIFGIQFGWKPGLGGLGGPEYLILPAITLGTALSGSVSRLTRSSMLDVLSQDYIRAARAKGLRERTVIYGHALKNAAIPVVTLLFMRLPFLFGGSIIVEKVFNWPGMGILYMDGVTTRDYPLIMGMVLISALTIVVSNLITDITYGVADPRIRYD